MRRSISYIGILILSWLLMAAAPSQTEPPPMATPVPPVPPDLQERWQWLLAVGKDRPWLLLFVVLVIVVIWIFRRFQKPTEKFIEDKVGETYKEIDNASKVSDAVREYLEKAIEDYKRLKFRGLERMRGLEPPELDQAFISIRLVPEVERPVQQHEKGKPGAEIQEENLRMREQSQPLLLAEAIPLAPKLAIIGGAGSGKSTLLQWAGLAAARSRMERARLSQEQLDFVQALGEKPLLPLLLPLRDFNRYCKTHKLDCTASAMLDFIRDYITKKHPGLKLPENFFETQLSKEGCLVMFDGVDEVNQGDRPRVREAIEAFVGDYQRNPRNRYLVTSRTVAYFGEAEVSGFRKCEVQHLDPEQRDLLVHKWCLAAYGKDEGARQAADLCARISASDESVRALAITPLMVTIFALVHYDKRDLPRQRAALYEHAVRILLTEPWKEGEAADDLKKDPETRRNHLSYIAFEMHSKQADDLLEDDLVDLVWRDFGSSADEKIAHQAARDFARTMADRGGLLEEENGHYGFFTHRTFREFLAGRYLAEEKSPGEQGTFLEDHLEEDAWEEPVRLAAGYLGISGGRRVNDFLRLLASVGKTPERRVQALTWAGLAISDLQPTKEAESPVRAETRQPIVEEMVTHMTAIPPLVIPRLRFRLGLALGAVGDPRLDPLNPPMLPVPAGPFRMDTSPQDQRRLKAQGTSSYEDEEPDHIVTLSAFEIGKYPVTNFEFRLFWQEHGYDQQELWSEDGWRWRTVEQRGQPFFWEDADWNISNLPVVGVCWFEAQAYCRWLSLKTSSIYRLPTEAEWEKAERGPEGRLWPWGDIWEPARCNHGEADNALNRTSPVGMYPDGASPYGVLDMAGNVWEWCADWYDAGEYGRRKNQEVVDPCGPQDGGARVVRGGSWHSPRYDVRCACRLRLVPDYFDIALGFRRVRSPK